MKNNSRQGFLFQNIQDLDGIDTVIDHSGCNYMALLRNQVITSKEFILIDPYIFLLACLYTLHKDQMVNFTTDAKR